MYSENDGKRCNILFQSNFRHSSRWKCYSSYEQKSKKSYRAFASLRPTSLPCLCGTFGSQGPEFQGVDRHHAACLRISLFGTLSLVHQDSWCTLEHCLNIAEILAAPCQHFCLSTQYMPRCGPKPVEIQCMLLYFGKTLCYRF